MRWDWLHRLPLPLDLWVDDPLPMPPNVAADSMEMWRYWSRMTLLMRRSR